MIKKTSFKNVDISYNVMKTIVLFVLAVGFISAQYLTINSCSDYNLGSNNALGFISPGVYPVFPVFNFTVFNTTITKSSDLPLYSNLCNASDNVFYGFNGSLQTCSSQASSSNAVWTNTGFSVLNLSVNVSLLNDSQFAYLPIKPDTIDLTAFYKQNPGFVNSLNKIVNYSNSSDSFNFTFYGLGFNSTSKCYFPIDLTASNFSVQVVSTSFNGALILTENQNETLSFSNSTGLLATNTFFSGKTLSYAYSGALPASFNVFVERLTNPSEITGLLIDEASLQVYFTTVEKAGLEVSYYSPQGHGNLLNQANPFDLKLLNVNGWNIEFETDSILNSTLRSSFGVSNVNVTITKTLTATQVLIRGAKNFLDVLLSSSPDKAKASAVEQFSKTKLAESEYTSYLTSCNTDLNTMLSVSGGSNFQCNSLSSCSQALGNPYSDRYRGFSDCQSYARSKSGYNG